MENLKLNKTSDESQIKNYFKKVLELKQSGEEFPVDLDDVWSLVYNQRRTAINELINTKDDFNNIRYIEGVDYQTWRKKVQAGKHNATIKDIYKLSVSGLEWFIARKIRPVFEVYRKVFHKAIELQHQLSWQGMPTIYDAGKVYCNYMSCLRTFKYSTRSGAVAARKRIHADSFKKFFNQNFITVEFADELKKQSEIRQLKMEFDKKIDIMRDVVLIENSELRQSITKKLLGGQE